MFTVFRTCVALGLSCTLAAAPAVAAPEMPQRLVHFSDLDLTTPAGARALHSRVLRAAREVCGGVDLRDLDPMREAFTACREAAQASATAQVQLALAKAQKGRALARNDMPKPM